MEIVLQWLDELDDLIFAGFPVWHGLRRLCLGVALGTALALPVVPAVNGTATAFVIAAVSLAALVAWALVAFVSFGVDRSARAVAGGA